LRCGALTSRFSAGRPDSVTAQANARQFAAAERSPGRDHALGLSAGPCLRVASYGQAISSAQLDRPFDRDQLPQRPRSHDGHLRTRPPVPSARPRGNASPMTAKSEFADSGWLSLFGALASLEHVRDDRRGMVAMARSSHLSTEQRQVRALYTAFAALALAAAMVIVPGVLRGRRAPPTGSARPARLGNVPAETVRTRCPSASTTKT
jgi:hypothetical protein